MATEETAGSSAQAQEPQTFTYWAFVSYSHRDEKVSAWLHRSIESYRIPRHFVGRQSVAGTVPRRLYPLFRDREEMASSASLTDNIRKALTQSRNLIVVCSPHAAASRWVNQEIAVFQQLERQDRVFCLIVDGMPNATDQPESGELECFPESVRLRVTSGGEREPLEPIAADIRKGKDGKLNAKLKLIAGMLGLRFDELKSREKRRQRWRHGLQSIAAALVLVVFLTVWFGVAKPSRDIALARELATKSEAELSNNPTEALVLAIDAAQTAHTYESERALRKAVNASQLRAILQHDGHPSLVALSADGGTLVAAAEGATEADVWDVASGQKRRTVRDDQIIALVTVSPDGRLLFLANHEGARVLDLETDRETTLTSQEGYSAAMGLGTPDALAIFSPDSERLLTAHYDSVVLWDVKSGGPRANLDMSHITAAAFSPDARRLVAGGGIVVQLLDAVTGHRIAALEHKRGVTDVAFSHDGQRIVSTTLDAAAHVWDGRDGRLLRVLYPHREAILSGAFSPDGQLLVTTSEDNTASLKNFKDGVQVSLSGHESWVRHATFSPDGRFLLTTSEDRTVRAWDTRTRTPLAVLVGHSKPVDQAVFSADAKHIVTTSEDGTARIWSTIGSEVDTLVGHERGLTSVAFSPDGATVLTASEDGTVRLWNVETGKQRALLRVSGEIVNHATFSPSGTRLLATSPQSVRVWDRDGEQLAELSREDYWGVNHAVFDRSGKRIVVTSYSGPATMWDWSENRQLFNLENPFATVASGMLHAVFSPDGGLVATTGRDGKARIWDVSTGEAQAVLSSDDQGYAHSQTVDVNHAAFDATGKRLVTAAWDGTARVFDTLTGEEFAVFEGHDGEVLHAVFSPDGLRIATAGYDRTARIWALPLDQVVPQPATTWSRPKRLGEQLHVLGDHTGIVNIVLFSPDGDSLLTASQDGTARLWDVETGKSIAVLEGHTAPIVDAAFSPDGTLILTASVDGTARLYVTSLDDLLRIAHNRLPRTIGD